MSNTYKLQLSSEIDDYQIELSYLKRDLHDVEQAIAKAYEVGLTEDSNVVKEWTEKKKRIEARIEDIDKTLDIYVKEYFNLD